MSDFCTAIFFLLEKVKLKKHKLSCQWESLSHQERGQQFTAVKSSMALSEILPKYSFFLFVGWLVGCLGFWGFFFWHGEQYFQKSRKKQLHHTVRSCTY